MIYLEISIDTGTFHGKVECYHREDEELEAHKSARDIMIHGFRNDDTYYPVHRINLVKLIRIPTECIST